MLEPLLLGLLLASPHAGTLDPELIRGVVRGHADQVRACYERELPAHPKLRGKVAVKFTIRPSGGVAEARVTRSTVSNPRLEKCISGRVRTWIFPKPTGGGSVSVTYPFVLKQSGE